MKKITKILSGAILAISLGLIFLPAYETHAEGDGTATIGTSISLTPVSKILQIASNSDYDEKFTVNNDGDSPMRIEVYAAPYSYVYSNEENLYKLGFSNENNFTQISRWITFKDNNGQYVEKAVFSIEPRNSLEISFRIHTPDNIPNGGQYAVIFAHTLSEPTSGNGIRTEASPGMVVYGRSVDGEAITSAEITDLSIEQKILEQKNAIVGSAKVKNTGNIDFTAFGTLKVEPIVGFGSYETPATNGRVSIIPEAELAVTDAWTDAPSLGIYKATWTVTAGEQTEVYESVIFRISPLVIIISIIVLTIIVISIIMVIRKRKERRSRLSV